MDYTQLSTFQTCPERYRLRYQEGLEKIDLDERMTPRQFGAAIHAALAAYYHGQDPQACCARFLETLGTVDPNEQIRTAAHGVDLLNAYFAYAAQQDQTWKVIGIEVADTCDLGKGTPYEVRLDLIIQTPVGLWGVEHKTTTKPLDERYWRQYEPNSQVSGYTYYLTQKYGQCNGVIINGLQIGHRQRAYKGQPAGVYWNFCRQVINRTPAQLEDWRVCTRRSLARLEETLTTKAWEKNESACGFCEYRELCMSVGNQGVKDVLYRTMENPHAYLQRTTVSLQ